MKTLFNTLLLLASVVGHSAWSFECPVTKVSTENPIEPWQQIDSQSNWSDQFAWHGSEELAALIPRNGQWVGMGPERDYFNKFWWWRKGFDSRNESQPDLTITATRLDEYSEPVLITNASSGINSSGWNAMLIGMSFPSQGCWKVMGSYKDTQLTLVFAVGDGS